MMIKNEKAGEQVMQQQASPQTGHPLSQPAQSTEENQEQPRARFQREQLCPQCGHPMSDLKGGREAICQNCGFKDSCCY